MSKITFQDKENLQSNPSVLRINKVIDEDINEIKEVVNNNDTNTNNNFGDSYSTSNTYNVGDYCVYEDRLYRCITAITTPESFNSAKWEKTVVTDEINERFKWKLAGTATGKTAITLPDHFNEILVRCNVNSDNYTNIIPKEILISTLQNFNIGGRRTTTNYGAGVKVNASLTSVNLEYLYSNGVDQSDNTTTRVYYR